MGLKGYRAGQITSWIYQHYAVFVRGDDEHRKGRTRPRLPRVFPDALLAAAAERSSDGTRKFLFGLDDGHTIESVLIPDDDGRRSAYLPRSGVSSLRFLPDRTGRVSTRNLAFSEIADQVLEVSRILRAEGSRGSPTSLLMGMG